MIKLITALLLATLPLLAQQRPELPLWPEGAPEKPDFKAEPEQDIKKDDGIRRVSHVSNPSITFFKAAEPNGTAILVCPGGGYNILAIEHEGSQVCDYLNSIGVSAVLLKYRVPRRDPVKPHEAPLQDARRAMTLIRNNAAEWGIQPDRIGVLGFSAGGNLCVMTALDPSVTKEDRPNFVVPIYPAYLTVDKEEFQLLPELQVTPETPPAFFIHAGDDRITAAGSALLYLEYKKQKVPAELHIYSSGGHGFGMKANGAPINQWHVRLSEWLKSMKLVP